MKKVKKISIFIMTCIFAIGMMSVSTNAATGNNTSSGNKLLQVSYGVGIIYNNKELTGTEAPFISNGRTYVPLRMLIENFGDKTITWDAANQKVIINDTTSSLEAQLADKNAQITALQSQIATLQAQIAELEDSDSSTSISNLEDSLNEDYEDYIESLTLNGDEDDITVTIKVDESDWDDLSTSEQENLLENICDDIWDDFEDADITGTVKDGSTTLQTFDASAGDSISFDTNFDSLIDDIEDNYESDWTDNGLPFSLTISGDEDDIIFELSFDYDTYESDWEDLSDSDLESMMDDIKDAIADEYDDADIIGYIYDSSSNEILAEYSDSSLSRYY